LSCRKAGLHLSRGPDQVEEIETVDQENARLTLILVGATGTGKTEVAIEIARNHIPGEIVSADSRLIYRHMDIATAKPDRQIMAQARHHMIDLIEPDGVYSCKQFQTDARRVVYDILRRGLTPIVVGGSGLYVKALTDGVFDGPAANDDVRERLEKEAEAWGPAHLWEKLNQVDPEKAARTDRQNAVRIVRALEVFEITGEKMSDIEQNVEPLNVPLIKIGLRRTTEDLHRRIDARVDRMMEEGLLAETRALIDTGYGESRAFRNTLGYRELAAHLAGRTTLGDAVDLIKVNTRRFAKRQGTWFKKDPEIHWIDVAQAARPSAIAQLVRQIYMKGPRQ
jgi:tRNA dimethylallyltransferase